MPFVGREYEIAPLTKITHPLNSCPHFSTRHLWREGCCAPLGKAALPGTLARSCPGTAVEALARPNAGAAGRCCSCPCLFAGKHKLTGAADLIPSVTVPSARGKGTGGPRLSLEASHFTFPSRTNTPHRVLTRPATYPLQGNPSTSENRSRGGSQAPAASLLRPPAPPPAPSRFPREPSGARRGQPEPPGQAGAGGLGARRGAAGGGSGRGPAGHSPGQASA